MSLRIHANDPGVRRYQEASEWLLRLNNEALSEEQVAEWLRWCEVEPENLAAFERMQRDWGDVAALRGRNPHVSSVSTRRRVVHAAAAGVAALAAGVLGVLVFRPFDTGGAQVTQEIEASRENRSATLPDGSWLVVAAQGAVNVDYTAQQRRLELKEGAEAYFKVQKDRNRPFVVHAGELTVTAVGTAFDVRHEADKVVVTVEEGVVNVAVPGGGQPDAPRQWTAVAGHRLEYSTQSATAVIAGIDASRSMRWREGEFAYVGEPLPDVIDEINRYSPERISIGDPALDEIAFTGTVFVRSLDDWLRALETRYPVRAERLPGGGVVLRAADRR